MASKDNLEIFNIYSNIAQAVVIVAAAFFAIYLYFVRFEHLPAVKISAEFVGIDKCDAVLQVKMKNIGRVPFELRKAIVLIDGNDRSTSQDKQIEQTIVGQETASIAMNYPVTRDYNHRIKNFQLALKIVEDGDETWRLWDQPIQLDGIPVDC